MVIRHELFQAFWDGDTKTAEDIISDLLFNTISYFDYKESYYYAFLVGIFTGAGYGVESNYEYGTGRPDIVIKDKRNRRVMVLEAKHAKTGNEISGKAKEALKQFADERYLEGVERGFRTKIGYAVIFHEKACFITKVD